MSVWNYFQLNKGIRGTKSGYKGPSHMLVEFACAAGDISRLKKGHCKGHRPQIREARLTRDKGD